MKKEHIGSSLDGFLREERICEEVTVGAIKRVLARQVKAAMAAAWASKAGTARGMRASGAAKVPTKRADREVHPT